MFHETRRHFLRLCASLPAAGALASVSPPTHWARRTPLHTLQDSALASPDREVRFLFVLYFSGGLAPHYLFDARPRAFSAAGLVENHIRGAAEPTLMGSGHDRALVSPLASRLLEHSDLFSVVNGVHMASSFNGHNENRNHLFTNNPFGGDSFLAAHALDPAAFPLGFFLERSIGARIQNLDQGLELSLQGLLGVCSSLAEPQTEEPRVRRESQSEPQVRTMSIISNRMEANGRGNGLFSAGARNFATAVKQSTLVKSRMQRVAEIVPSGFATSLEERLNVCAALFEAGLTGVVALDITPSAELDVHNPQLAAEQHSTYEKVVQNLETFFRFFRSRTIRMPTTAGVTDASSGDSAGVRALSDCCSFLIGSEFGRTFRQTNKPIEQTGTDHNPHGNSVLIGGAGLKAGRVVGTTDADALGSDGGWDSSALLADHAERDPHHLSGLGRPYDFQEGKTLRNAQNLRFDTDPDRFLHMGNVINTLASAAGVHAEHWLTAVGRSSAPYRLLTHLLS